MHHRGLWLWVIASGGAALLSFAACTTYSSLDLDCEGAECDIDNADAGSSTDRTDSQAPNPEHDGGGQLPGDAASDADAADGDVSDVIPPDCDAARSPAEDDCVIDDAYGVFVSPTGSDQKGSGTRAAPFASLGHGLLEAKIQSKRLYVCDNGEGFTEKIEITAPLDGLEAFGGFSCDDWSYGNSKAKIRTEEPGVVWRFDHLSQGFLLDGFDIGAQDAEAPGKSSIAVIVNESVGVVFRDVDISAGKGAAGASGSSLETAPPQEGEAGNPGRPSECIVSINPGGEAANMSCGGLSANGGGKGGDGTASSPALDGERGLPETMSGGTPGAGGTSALACSPGGRGEDGADGEAGHGARGAGRLTSGGWVGESGQAGKGGSPGQGGGGGGGVVALDGCPGPGEIINQRAGASGGSGGGGGCGGRRGEGGKPGGSSIAIVAIDSQLLLEGCRLVSSQGGDGGSGAAGQLGGQGGKGGDPGGVDSDHVACSGGDGGNGGRGGRGGGGAGGHSIGIAFLGAEPERVGGSIDVGAAGAGGPGVDSTNEGEEGTSAAKLSF